MKKSKDDSDEGPDEETGERSSNFNELISLEDSVCCYSSADETGSNFWIRWKEKMVTVKDIYSRLMSRTTVQISDYDKELLRQSYDAV